MWKNETFSTFGKKFIGQGFGEKPLITMKFKDKGGKTFDLSYIIFAWKNKAVIWQIFIAFRNELLLLGCRSNEPLVEKDRKKIRNYRNQYDSRLQADKAW